MSETSQPSVGKEAMKNMANLLIKNAEVKQQASKARKETAGPPRKYLEELAGRGQVKRTIKGVQKA